jgi:tol-pal system protein YbgF
VPAETLGMRTPAVTVLIGCLLAALSGCAGSGAVKKLTDESRASREQLAEVGRATEELRTGVAALRAQLDGMRRDLDKNLQDRDRAQRETLDELGKRMAATEKRVDALAGAVRGVEMTVGGIADQVARLEAVSTSAGARRDGRSGKATARAAAATLAAEELYTRATESFKGGELAQAILDFEDFVARYPSHPLAGSAQFWIGEAYYNARDYQHATSEYRKAVEIAPKGEKAPEALFKLGLAYRTLRRGDRARETWVQLVRDFPQSEAAQKARLAMREVARPAKSGAAPETR